MCILIIVHGKRCHEHVWIKGGYESATSVIRITEVVEEEGSRNYGLQKSSLL